MSLPLGQEGLNRISEWVTGVSKKLMHLVHMDVFFKDLDALYSSPHVQGEFYEGLLESREAFLQSLRQVAHLMELFLLTTMKATSELAARHPSKVVVLEASETISLELLNKASQLTLAKRLMISEAPEESLSACFGAIGFFFCAGVQSAIGAL